MNVEEFLMHYASEYYDPVKAHEYYMKTRELKGRRSTSGLNDEGKEKWAYVKNEVKTAKDKDVEAEKENRDKKLEEYRSKAAETRTRIADKLKILNQTLSKTSSRKKKTIESVKKSKIARLQSQKKRRNLSDADRRRIDKEIFELQEKAKTDQSDVVEKTQSTREQNSSDAATQREKCATDLKTAISATREAYKVAKTKLDESYETIYQQEYDKIATEYANPKKRR